MEKQRATMIPVRETKKTSSSDKICKNCEYWVYCEKSGADPMEQDLLCFNSIYGE